MSAQRSKHVRLYLAAAGHRLDEAEFLRTKGERTLGAIYLAGYAVECVLKALILSLFGEHEQPAVMQRFRGAWAHDYGELKSLYRKSGGAGFPREVAQAFALVDDWGTDLRYSPRAEYPGDASEFFGAVDVILRWATQRL
jgi:HEPN domain-containing protein